MAVTSGTVYSGYAKSSRLYVSWSQTSQSIANNYTDIKWTAGIIVGGSNKWYSNAVKITSVYINGVKVSSGGTYSNLTSNGTYQKLSGTARIYHDSDGSKTFGVSIAGWFYDYGDKSGSNSFALTTIPRVSDLSVNKTSVPADGTTEVIATATKKSSSFTDTIIVKLGDYSQTVTSGTAFTIPDTWINAISGTSAVATVTVTTKSGSTTIGTKSVNLTVTVPDSVVPVINDVSITEAVAAVTTAFGSRFVQNLSQLNVSIDASGVYSSTIKSYSTTIDGVTYIQQAFTSNIIKTSGTITATAKVTDSRGRTASTTVSINIIEYTLPTITAMSYIHCDADGTQNANGTSTKVTISGKVYPVANQNTKALKLKYRAMSDETYTERAITISDWTFTVNVIINNTDPTITYEYIAELTDKINESTPETYRITTGIVVLSRKAGGSGITLFGEAEEDGFVVGGSKTSKFTGDMLITVDSEFESLWTSVFGSGGGVVHLLDYIYPIGHILETTNADFNPNNWYKWQTWERWGNGKVVVGVDEDDATFATVEETGGEKTHILSLNEIPSHEGHLPTNAGTSGYGNSATFLAKSKAFTSYGSKGRGWNEWSGGEMLPAGVSRGSGGAHNNLQPYITAYRWRRTA